MRKQTVKTRGRLEVSTHSGGFSVRGAIFGLLSTVSQPLVSLKRQADAAFVAAAEAAVA
jgi:hypothetical protein